MSYELWFSTLSVVNMKGIFPSDALSVFIPSIVQFLHMHVLMSTPSPKDSSG